MDTSSYHSTEARKEGGRMCALLGAPGAWVRGLALNGRAARVEVCGMQCAACRTGYLRNGWRARRWTVRAWGGRPHSHHSRMARSILGMVGRGSMCMCVWNGQLRDAIGGGVHERWDGRGWGGERTGAAEAGHRGDGGEEGAGRGCQGGSAGTGRRGPRGEGYARGVGWDGEAARARA